MDLPGAWRIWLARYAEGGAALTAQTTRFWMRRRSRACRQGLVGIAEVTEMYVERVPDRGYENSCIFHGAKGCTLDRSTRSDVCNSYFCHGLHSFMSSVEEAGPTVVISGELDRMRLSPVLVP